MLNNSYGKYCLLIFDQTVYLKRKCFHKKQRRNLTTYSKESNILLNRVIKNGCSDKNTYSRNTLDEQSEVNTPFQLRQPILTPWWTGRFVSTGTNYSPLFCCPKKVPVAGGERDEKGHMSSFDIGLTKFLKCIPNPQIVPFKAE